ncbi:receptor-type tyrosine-protein phosphatase H-like [Mytilus edulis]|uniref:receptor-type tyrosine-protein phosphatase H-like n=1 Tax=Mytilus edulis TaxID=6550 RepID=UPI0039EE7264
MPLDMIEVNGNWSSYTTESKNCSKACGAGFKTEQLTRTCTNPKPQFGGENCKGPSSVTNQVPCNQGRCPDPPEDIQIQTQTSSTIFLRIVPANINYTSFLVYVRSKELEALSTNYTVTNLKAATCYNISVLTKFRDIISSQAISRNFCTAPPSPESASLSDVTTTSITIVVQTHYSFDVFMNGKLFSSFTPKNKFGTETVMIEHLTPGATYHNTQVYCISNGLRSLSEKIFTGNEENEIHLPPEPPSSIKIFTQTNDSLSFNITHGAGLFDHFNISMIGKCKLLRADVNSTFIIAFFGDLDSGTLYKNITVRSISNNTLSVPTPPIEHTTNSNPPSNVDVENQNDTSVALSIARESGKFDKLFVWIERVNIYVETPQNTKIIIGGLEPGNQYLAMVGTTSNGLNSTAYTLTINTNPDRPVAVYLLNRTTESLGIKIVQGQGITEWFYIQINDRYNVKGKINQTDLVLEKLTPGQMYSDIKVQAVSHVPDAPSLVQVSDKTTETLIIMIVHGKGIVELFHIDIDGKNHSQKATSDSNTTYVTIGHLTPGTLYKDITIYSISNRLESDARKIDASATYPSSPSLQVKDNSINVIRIVIMKGSGGVEKYKILVNNEEVIDVTYNQSSQEVNITDRVPGKMYNITAKAIANNIESNLSSNIQQATY